MVGAGLIGNGSVFRLLGANAPAVLWKHLDWLNAWIGVGQPMALPKPFFGERSIRSSGHAASYRNSPRLTWRAKLESIGASGVTHAPPGIAPIRAAGGVERVFREKDASGSWEQSSSAVSKKSLSFRESRAVAPRAEPRRAGGHFFVAPEAEERPGYRASVALAIEKIFAEQARLPPSGIGGFDPRLSPAWAGLQIPG